MKLNFLVSYAYWDDLLYNEFAKRDPSDFRLMIDSGAFTAWNKGRVIKIPEYAAFLRSLPREWEWRAIQLDVIGDPEGTKRHFAQLQHEEKVDTIPVFTRGAPASDRDYYYERADYLCFGGIVNTPAYHAFLRWLMETNEQRQVHWLGYTNIEDMKRYKPTSVDSSNFAAAERYGHLHWYDKGGRMRVLDRGATWQRPSKEFFAACRRVGWRSSELRNLGFDEAWKGGVREPGGASIRGFAAYVGMTHFLAHAQDIGRNLGTRVYTAVAHDPQLRCLFHAADFMRSRGVEV